MMRRNFTIFEFLLTIVISALLVGCLGVFWIFELPFHVSVGWIFFLGRIFQQTSFSPGAFATAVACSLGFVFGLHFFIRRKSENFAHFKWNWKQSLIVSTATVLMFVAGISIVGVTHQTSWLIASPEPWIQGSSVRDAARRTQSRNMLKQIGLASHYYHDAYEILPVGGSFDSDGRGLHSWETFLLPYLDQAELYEKIDLAKPWTDEVHRASFQQGINAFRNPKHSESLKEIDWNHSHYAMNAHVAGINRNISMSYFSDGKSNTLLTGEVKHAPRAWGDPVNFRDPAIGFESPISFGSVWRYGGVQFTFADGSVRMINNDIDLAVLKALSTPSGGEVIDDF